MRFPIRNQILLPLAGLQIVVVSAVSVWAAWQAADRVENDAQRSAARVRGLLERATFPLTKPVLDQIRLLSGADFIVLDAFGQPAMWTLSQPTLDSVALRPDPRSGG